MEINYNEIGFRCGIEVHQQLEGRKLFCNCPAINSSKEPNIRVVRRLRAVAGETGEVDIAAKHEMGKGKYFIYESNSEDTCLVEYDEQPPEPINEELMDAAIEISLLLNAKVVNEVQVMRKTVVDGSNTAGFQRTALVAQNGYIETSKGRVRIPTICLEEEAAQKIEETKEYVKYKLDRLGIGLIEIGTDASIKDAEHAKETASLIGMVLRSTGKVKRGLGTIRQDVNISIKGGARTEIKGFQDLRSIPKIINYEVGRQLSLIKKNEKIEESVRKAEPDFTTSFLRPMPGAARMYPETDVMPVRITEERIERIRKNLPKLLNEKVTDFAKKYNVKEELAKELLHHRGFESYVNKFKRVEPMVIAHILVNVPKEIRKRFNLDVSKIAEGDFEEILSYLNEGRINKEAVIELLIKKIRNEKIELDKYKSISREELEKEIEGIVRGKPGLNVGAYMGIVMGRHRGRVNGKTVMEILKEVMKKE
jgi:Glu-tRNA(Gln) amidotransferase subunit E-like FAD-binding protein